jgi:pimeloyl-ACP methyl ester carboxylesterase
LYLTDITEHDTDVDDDGDGRGALAAAGLSCGSCGSQLSAAAKFCSECGTPVTQATQPAEYKQVTVLFADVVHSMDIAAAVGGERLREIMKSPTLRRKGMQDFACHGDRLTPSQALELTDDSLNCAVIDDLSAVDWVIAPLDPLPCPITIAWSEKDAVLPVAAYRDTVRERLPQATFETSPGVGHVPVIDDLALVARTILAVTSAAV